MLICKAGRDDGQCEQKHVKRVHSVNIVNNSKYKCLIVVSVIIHNISDAFFMEFSIFLATFGECEGKQQCHILSYRRRI